MTDAKVLSTAMERVKEVHAPGGVKGDGTVFAINNNAQPTLATLRYKLKDATMEAAEEAVRGRRYRNLIAERFW